MAIIMPIKTCNNCKYKACYYHKQPCRSCYSYDKRLWTEMIDYWEIL